MLGSALSPSLWMEEDREEFGLVVGRLRAREGGRRRREWERSLVVDSVCVEVGRRSRGSESFGSVFNEEDEATDRRIRAGVPGNDANGAQFSGISADFLDFLDIYEELLVVKGGLPMYVATRKLYQMKQPTIFVPASIKESVERLFDVHRALDQSELRHTLIGMNVGDEFQIRKDLKVKAFRTYHVISSQGYIIYSVKQKLKQEYMTLSGHEIKSLRLSGVEVTYTVTSPEIAFTGDTMSDFVVDPNNADVLKARILIMESTFVDNAMSIEHAREYGHTHMSEIASYAEKFQNKAIVLIHFSARYTSEEIEAAIAKLPATLAGRVYALLQGF